MSNNSGDIAWPTASHGNTNNSTAYIQGMNELPSISLTMLSNAGIMAQRSKHFELIGSFLETQYILHGVFQLVIKRDHGTHFNLRVPRYDTEALSISSQRSQDYGQRGSLRITCAPTKPSATISLKVQWRDAHSLSLTFQVLDVFGSAPPFPQNTVPRTTFDQRPKATGTMNHTTSGFDNERTENTSYAYTPKTSNGVDVGTFLDKYSPTANTSTRTWVQTGLELASFIPILSKIRTGLIRGLCELYLECEGSEGGMSGKGSIAWLAITVRSLGHTWLLNVSRLGSKVFEASDANGLSLRKILGSSAYCQGWFDVRNDACALFEGYGVTLGCVRDIQLLNVAGRLGERRTHLSGLYNCMQEIGREFMSKQELNDWLETKRDGKEFFAKYGWNVQLEWPLSNTVKGYAAGDTPYLPMMEEAYLTRIKEIERLLESNSGRPFFLLELADRESIKRARDSILPGYDPDTSKTGAPNSFHNIEMVHGWEI